MFSPLRISAWEASSLLTGPGSHWAIPPREGRGLRFYLFFKSSPLRLSGVEDETAGSLSKFPGVHLAIEENPVNRQLGGCLKVCDQSSPQMGPLSTNHTPD